MAGCDFFEDPGDFEDFEFDKLQVDEAYLRVVNDEPVVLYSLSEECYDCPFQPLLNMTAASTTNLKISTKNPWTFMLSWNSSNYISQDESVDYEICDKFEKMHLGEFGVYEIKINGTDCTFDILKDPVFEYGAIIMAIIVYALVALIAFGVEKANQKGYIHKLFSCGKKQEVDLELELKMKSDKEAPPTGKVRLKSLDTFRGISIVLMIFVNHGAGRYWFLEHAPWNGLQVADLVFPWFMWIMGVCIPMGLRSQLRRKTPKIKIFTRIFERSLKLFFIGIILSSLGGYNKLETYRVPGVLQRFGISYLVTSTVALVLAQDPSKEYKSKILTSMTDILYLLPQWIFYLSFLTIYMCLVFLMPVEGCPTGYLGPGGVALMEDGIPLPDCIGGATRQIDLWLVGDAHMYQNPTAKFVYSASSFDPEGVLGSMTTIFQVFLGVQAGYILQFFPGHGARVRRWLLWAFITGTFATVFTYGTMNDGPIPVNKNLWSLSFVMVTSCFAFFLLAICYLVIDVAKWWSGTPFYQAGMNGIFLYVGHNVAYNVFPWRYQVGNMNTHIEYLTETLWGTTLWVLVALYLHHKKRFYTI